MKKLLEQWDNYVEKQSIIEEVVEPAEVGFNVKPHMQSQSPEDIVVALLQEILAELKTLTYHSTPARGPVETGLEKALATTIQEVLKRRRGE
tara:strand:- start:125 stop:400 length:276 start_codon:yes stop_codon:yes gene_type:complete